jgi:hypothetical protein
MNATPHGLNSRTGSTLIVVLSMTMLGMMATASVMFYVGSRVKQAYKQVDLEKAFYIASGGAERAASRVAAGNETSATLTNVLGNGSYVAVIDCLDAGGEVKINITSRGTVKGVSRTVVLRGVRRVSWARYALWYEEEAGTLWMFPGERFDGRVYSKPQFHFHNQDLATKGQVHFADKAWSAASSIEKASSSVNPVFEQGLTLDASPESMASVDFSDLLAQAVAGGLVLEGETTMTIDNQTMRITNARKKWTNKATPIPANGLVYVKTVTSGTDPRTGNITLGAPNGLNGRLTLVSDNEIKIIDHVRYKSNPQTITNSTDALGLIAKQSVAVQTSAPKNLDIYAHIMCQNGGFGVVNYNSGSARGTLTVYGGIVNKMRNAVNTGGGTTGYRKNYIFDKRFSKNPPPKYPVLTDELEWVEWEG